MDSMVTRVSAAVAMAAAGAYRGTLVPLQIAAHSAARGSSLQCNMSTPLVKMFCGLLCSEFLRVAHKALPNLALLTSQAQAPPHPPLSV